MTELKTPGTGESVEPAPDPFADLRLTEWTSCGGCAAKWGASLLTKMVREMPAAVDPSLLVGLAPFDDAAIYEMAPGVALVSTTDFFPPLVDHPSDFGAIAGHPTPGHFGALDGQLRQTARRDAELHDGALAACW